MKLGSWKRAMLKAVAVTVGIGLAAFGCAGAIVPTDGDGTVGGNDNGESGGAAAASFSRDLQPILTATCAGCHSPGGVADLSGIDLRLTEDVAYDLLATGMSVQNADLAFVVPGNADASLFFQKVSSDDPPVGVRMPRSAPPLDQDQIDLIETWINEGALDN